MQSHSHSPQNPQHSASQQPSNKQAQKNETGVDIAQGSFLQTKLTVNTPGDRYEREADAVADRLMCMPNGAALTQPSLTPVQGIQRKCAACEKDEETLQRKEQNSGAIASPAIVSQLVESQSRGRPLPVSTQSFMSSAIGADFNSVRVHTDGAAAQMNQQLNARAFTYGSDIYFNQGQYNPESAEGKRLLGHELTHVVQQGADKPGIQRSVATLTQAARNRISYWDIVLNSAIFSQSALEDYFRAVPPRSSIRFGGTINIDAAVPRPSTPNPTYDFNRGLENLPGHLVATHNMPENTTVTTRIDLSPFGGQDGNYRLTYVNTNTSGRGAATYEFHIEYLGAVRSTPAQSTRPSAISIGSRNFRAIGWPGAQYDQLMVALGLIPATALGQIDNMTFRYRSVVAQSTTQLGEDGHADLATGSPPPALEITIWSSVTRATALSYGGYSRTVFVIAHEIGHHLDFNPIRTTNINNPSGTADSVSGYYRYTGNGNFDENANRRTAFNRLTVHNQPITTYGGTNLAENYAEFFAMYVTDPTLLQQLRPDIHQFFQRRYP